MFLLQKYLGPSSFLLDNKKLSLISDKINLKQWAVNMDFIFSGISPDMLLEHSSLLGEDKAELFKNTTAEVRTVLKGLSSVLYFPTALEKETHAWAAR